MDAVEKGRFLGKSKFSTYIIGIVKHKWWAELKRTGRFDPIEWLSKNKEGEPDEDFELGLADTDEEYQQIIAEAIPQLGERCQGMLKDALAGRNSDFLIEKYQFSSKEMAKKESYRCRERLENIIRSKPALHQKLKDLMCRK